MDEAIYRGLFKGMSNTKFGPQISMTRGQFVTVLYRMYGAPDVNVAAPFADVDSKAYYADAVAWAYEEGYVKGISDKAFGPDAPMTREMVVTILWRMEDEPVSKQALTAYADANRISTYARQAMAWAVEQNLIQGVSETSLAPQGVATRAQGALLLVRYARAFCDS